MLSKIPTARLFLSSRLLPELHLRMKIHQGTCVQLSLNLTGTVSRQTVRHCLVSPINICTRRCWSKQSHFSGHLITAPAGRRNSLRTVTTVNGGDEDHRCYDVDTDELVTMIQRNNKNTSHMLLVDVREPEELLQTGEIPGSINIPCMFTFITTYTCFYYRFASSMQWAKWKKHFQCLPMTLRSVMELINRLLIIPTLSLHACLEYEVWLPWNLSTS